MDTAATMNMFYTKILIFMPPGMELGTELLSYLLQLLCLPLCGKKK